MLSFLNKTFHESYLEIKNQKNCQRKNLWYRFLRKNASDEKNFLQRDEKIVITSI